MFSRFSEEDDSPGEVEIPTGARTDSKRSGRKKKKGKVRNGHNHVDMTPPDKHLKKSEKRAKRYAEKKKVQSFYLYLFYMSFTRMTQLV